MIPQTNISCQTVTDKAENSSKQSWQNALISAIRDPAELCKLLELNPEQLQLSEKAHQDFSVLVPRYFINLMRKGDPRDPLLLQVLNSAHEEMPVSGYSSDPLNESEFNVLPGLVHKYMGRVLLIVTGKCAINCRYCFRRSFPYSENKISRQEWLKAMDYIQADSSITEVIFSGGDPLSASDNQLEWLVKQVEQIAHVRRLRIHTRLPVVIPTRICDGLLKWASETRLKIQLVLHINHANEISDEFENALLKLRTIGIQVLNQFVLLKGINDDIEALQSLQETAFDAGVLPYYAFCLDKVAGAAHFEVTQESARDLFAELRTRLPGYLVPKLAVEEPGKAGKTLIF